MNTKEKKLNRVVTLVKNVKKLSSLEDIAVLHDDEILRISGIGRTGLALLREAYPIDWQKRNELDREFNHNRNLIREREFSNGTEFIRRGARLKIGIFHNVSAVEMTNFGILLQCLDGKFVLQIKPVFEIVEQVDEMHIPEPSFGLSEEENMLRTLMEAQSQGEAKWKDICVSGEFGRILEGGKPEAFRGIEIDDVVKMEIIPDFEDNDFHTRLLRLKNRLGVTLEWELYCDGRYSKVGARKARAFVTT